MAQALELDPGDRALEVGAGSGYAAAVLSRLVARVDAVEVREALARRAAANLAAAGVANVAVHHADGTAGWPEGAPYDVISVAAGGPRVPAALREQLAPGGRLVMPVGRQPAPAPGAGGAGRRARRGSRTWASRSAWSLVSEDERRR